MGKDEVVLVTGGAGQIGSHVVDELVGRGYTVIVLDRAPPLVEWKDLIEKDRIIYMHGYSSDLNQVVNICKMYGDELSMIFDIGAHLGGEELTARSDSALHENVIGTRNILELARLTGAWVYHISIEFAGYGFSDGYSLSKEMALRLCKEYVKKYGVYCVSSYVHHIFSSRQRLMPARKIMPTLIAYAVTGRTFRLFGSPNKVMDLLWAVDFARIVVDLLCSGEAETVDKHVYDIGAGKGIPLKELVEEVYRAVGKEPNYVVMEDVRKQSPDPYRVASNDWIDVIGDRPRTSITEYPVSRLVEEYLKKYSYEEFELAVAIYEQRHRKKIFCP